MRLSELPAELLSEVLAAVGPQDGEDESFQHFVKGHLSVMATCKALKAQYDGDEEHAHGVWPHVLAYHRFGFPNGAETGLKHVRSLFRYASKARARIHPADHPAPYILAALKTDQAMNGRGRVHFYMRDCAHVRNAMFSSPVQHPVLIEDRRNGETQDSYGLPTVAVFEAGMIVMPTAGHIERMIEVLDRYESKRWTRSADHLRRQLEKFRIVDQVALASSLLFSDHRTSVQLYISPSNERQQGKVDPVTPTIENPYGLTLLDLVDGIIDACTSSPHAQICTSMRIGGVHWRDDGLLGIDELAD